jgi:hypothetical protein
MWPFGLVICSQLEDALSLTPLRCQTRNKSKSYMQVNMVATVPVTSCRLGKQMSYRPQNPLRSVLLMFVTSRSLCHLSFAHSVYTIFPSLLVHKYTFKYGIHLQYPMYLLFYLSYNPAGLAQWYRAGLRAGWPSGSSPGRGWEFFSSPPRPDRLWSLPRLLSNGYQGLFPLGWRWTLPSSAGIQKAWSCTSIHPIRLPSWRCAQLRKKKKGTEQLHLYLLPLVFV